MRPPGELGRILGLDVGDRRIGVAISDPGRSFALPLHSVERDRRGSEFEALAALVRDEDVTEVVVGLPLTLAGETGTQAQSATAFGQELGTRLGLPIHFWDERLSTQEAIRRVGPERHVAGGRRGRSRAGSADTDAIAASIILQAYLDRQRLAGT